MGRQLRLSAHWGLNGLAMQNIKTLPLRLLFSVAMTLIALIGAPDVANAADEGLGISLQVIQGQDDSSKDLNKNNKLWFVIEPGQSGSREFQIRSASAIDQLIHLDIGAQKQVNGALQFDPDSTSPASEWVEFSNNDFVLVAGAIVTVSMTIAVPASTAVQTMQPSLLVKTSAIQTEDTQYKVPTALQFSQSIFLGIGTSDEFLTAFSIDDVVGANGNNGHVLVVKLTNTGKTPIALVGTLQLSNLTFTGINVGPLTFITNTIDPGTTAHVEVPVDDTVTEDKWRIYITAKQGSIVETRTFDKDIRFSGTNYLALAQWSGLIILLSAGLMLISIRTLRSIRRKQADEEAARQAEADRVAELERRLLALQEAAKPKRKPRKPPESK